jgi:hypothetical protein
MLSPFLVASRFGAEIQLAERAGISYPTVQRAESTDDVPRMKTTNLLAIQRVLDEAGVTFLDPGEHRDGGVGVRLWITR